MEYKSLKIDSDLHEKLKELSDEKRTPMQNLIEKKLSELISHEEDLLFNLKEVVYDPQIKLYNITLEEESYKKLINFFELFLTNRNLKNINEIDNLLSSIRTLKMVLSSNLKSNVENLKENYDSESEKKDKPESTFKSNKDLDKLINETSRNSIKDMYLQSKEDIDKYLNSLDCTNESKIEEREEIIEKIDFDEIEKNYKGYMMNVFSEAENYIEEMVKKEKEEFDDKIKNQYPKEEFSLKEGNKIKNTKDEEFEIVKICKIHGIEDNIYTLKSTSPLFKDVNTETSYSYRELQDRAFTYEGKNFLSILTEIDTDFRLNINKIKKIKSEAIKLKKEITIKDNNIINFIEDDMSEEDTISQEKELSDNILKLENIIETAIPYEEALETFKDVKKWFIEKELDISFK